MRRYEITVDEARNALWAKSHGFWNVAEVRAYLAELRPAAARIGHARSWSLIDLSDGTLQAREVTDLMPANIPGLQPPDAVVAVATPGALHALHAKRVVADDTHQYFTTVAGAEAWLDEQGRSA